VGYEHVHRRQERWHRAAVRRTVSLWGLTALEIKDDARLPASLDLCDRDLMIGHSFDLRVNGMAVWVERFAGHGGRQVGCLLQR
jgi:hypothetical protein